MGYLSTVYTGTSYVNFEFH